MGRKRKIFFCLHAVTQMLGDERNYDIRRKKLTICLILMNLFVTENFLPFKAHQISRELTYETDLYKTKISDKTRRFADSVS